MQTTSTEKKAEQIVLLVAILDLAEYGMMISECFAPQQTSALIIFVALCYFWLTKS